MSNQYNDILAERLFERLEGLEAFMNEREYTNRQQELLRALADGQFEEAEEHVLRMEIDYAQDKARMLAEDKQEALSGDAY